MGPALGEFLVIKKKRGFFELLICELDSVELRCTIEVMLYFLLVMLLHMSGVSVQICMRTRFFYV